MRSSPRPAGSARAGTRSPVWTVRRRPPSRGARARSGPVSPQLHRRRLWPRCWCCAERRPARRRPLLPHYLARSADRRIRDNPSRGLFGRHKRLARRPFGYNRATPSPQLIRVDRFLPHPEAGEDVRRHVQRMRHIGRDLGVTNRRIEPGLGKLRRVVAVDQVVHDTRMVRLFLPDLVQDFRRLF